MVIVTVDVILSFMVDTVVKVAVMVVEVVDVEVPVAYPCHSLGLGIVVVCVSSPSIQALL